ncbi:MAG: hypothetical protein KA354_20200 [Phycisphaerae bacterium]|nr:hypothetical protein [Phycisphaerae bacterium]
MHTRRELLGAAVGSAALGWSASAMGVALSRPDEAGAANSSEGDSIVPRSRPPAGSVLVATLQGLSPGEASAFTVMQGLVNRTQPRVYFVHDVEDAYWLHWLQERGDVDRVEWIGRYDIFRRVRGQIKGCIVTDPALPATNNVAMLLGSIDDCLVVSPDLLDAFDLPIHEDLRGRWSQPADAYRWAYENLFDSASRQLLAHMGAYSCRLRDYMTEFKVFTFWLSGKDDDNGHKEVALAREVFQRIGPNHPVVGWWGAHGQAESRGIGEGPGVDLIAQYGLFTDCMDLDGHCQGTSNVSVHSGTRAVFKQKAAPPVPKLENKVYFSFVRTDGDGTNFWRQEFLRRWSDPQHGRVAISWPIGPMASDFIPDIMDWFYRYASANDHFMVAVSGIGYTRENLYGAELSPEMRSQSFEQFRRLTAKYMKRMDLHHIHTHKTSSPSLVEEYAHIEGLDGLFLNYDREPDTTADNATESVNGVPVFRSVTVGPEVKGESWPAKIQSVLAQIREFTPVSRPAFLHVTLQNWCVGEPTNMLSCEVIRDIQQALGADYVAVRADHLAELYAQHKP